MDKFSEIRNTTGFLNVKQQCARLPYPLFQISTPQQEPPSNNGADSFYTYFHVFM
jgi:hypothetical protein